LLADGLGDRLDPRRRRRSFAGDDAHGQSTGGAT
jgi:hypothetical protein